MSAQVRVVGAAQLRRTMRKAGQSLDDLKRANAAAAALVATVARQPGRAPRRTGRLAGTVRGNRAAGRATISAGGFGVQYARPIHWGWRARGIEPQPWISQAAQETEPQWLAMYQQDIERVLDQVKGA